MNNPWPKEFEPYDPFWLEGLLHKKFKRRNGTVIYGVIGARVDRSYERDYHFVNEFVMLQRHSPGSASCPVGSRTLIHKPEFDYSFEPVLPQYIPNEPTFIKLRGPSAMPIGWCGPKIGFHKDDEIRELEGGMLKKEDYPELYEVIERIYGEYTGEEFQLPDLRGRIVVEGDK